MRLPCPACGHETLLAIQVVHLVPADLPSVEGELWGRPPVRNNTSAVCNRHACNWSGTVAEARVARRATLDVGPESG